MFISTSFKCLKCYVLMFPILIAQLIVSSLAKVLSLYTFYAHFNTLPIALHLLGYIYRVSVTQNMNLTKDFIGCSLIVNGENGGHGHYYQNWDLCSDWPRSIYEGKAVCFFCIVIMRSTKLGSFRSCSWYLWKALEEGCMGLVPWC